jgi:SAM-dependent methyltransferase
MPDESSHWGVEPVDPRAISLPGLKARFLLAHVPRSGSVCEIGCGEGKMLRTLAGHRPGLELHGCDVREPRSPPDVFTFHRMGDKLPFGDASFDVVLVFDVLEHVPDPAQTLSEAARVLKPSGGLIAFVPVEGERVSFYSLYRRLLGTDTYAKTKEHIQAFHHDELLGLLRTHFELREVRYAYHAFGQLMDASFFAAARLPLVRDFWWRDNVYYNGAEATRGLASRALNTLLELGNAAAWAESTLLARVRASSAGVLVSALRRNDA